MGHHHSHGHSHGHGHHHQSNYNAAFAIGVGLNVLFVIAEVFYGLVANSSALLADAGHNASDVLSLVFAWFAIWLSKKKPKGRFTYGFKQTTILVSLLNAVLLFVAIAVIGWEAYEKFKSPQPVGGIQVMIVAGIGVLINGITALLFARGQKHDLNIRGAFLHMAADAIVSLGVVLSGLLILKTGANWIDPIMSFIIIGVIFWGTWKLFVESVKLSLGAVPSDVNLDEVRTSLLGVDTVEYVHDLHLWAVSTSENILTAHVVSKNEATDELLKEIQHMLAHDYSIKHSTIQIEKGTMLLDCEMCNGHYQWDM